MEWGGADTTNVCIREQQTTNFCNREQEKIQYATFWNGDKETTNFWNREQETIHFSCKAQYKKTVRWEEGDNKLSEQRADNNKIHNKEKGQILNLGTEEQEIPVALTNS
jgi:hypothetical protein